jgi:hypothetical protein
VIERVVDFHETAALLPGVDRVSSTEMTMIDLLHD